MNNKKTQMKDSLKVSFALEIPSAIPLSLFPHLPSLVFLVQIIIDLFRK